jgi:addiction module HigA family antidote
LVPLSLSPYALAKICDVPRTRIERIAREEISITADTALRLSKALGTTAGFWLNLQTQFDIATAEKAIGKAIQSGSDNRCHRSWVVPTAERIALQ